MLLSSSPKRVQTLDTENPWRQPVNVLRLQPVINTRPTTKGVSPISRHPCVCIDCKKFKAPTNSFFQKDYSSRKRYCRCSPPKKPERFYSTLCPLTLSGLRARRYNRSSHSLQAVAKKTTKNSPRTPFKATPKPATSPKKRNKSTPNQK